MIIRQSDLNSYAECPQRQKLDRDAAASGLGRRELSATVYGSVLHHALMVMDQAIALGKEDPLGLALRTFEYYWDQEHVEELPGVARITDWVLNHTWHGLLARSKENLASAYEALSKEASFVLLGIEIEFNIPLDLRRHGAGEHILHGTIDRLGLRMDSVTRKPYISVEDHKGLSVETPIPTPTGWTTMGDLRVGDQVFGSDGRPCLVTVKSGLHHRPCYRVTFDDGSSIVCDNVHLWQVDIPSGPYRGKGVVLSTEQLAKIRALDSHQRVINIPTAGSLELPREELPIDPYVLGLWLGDGTESMAWITKADPFVFEECERRGFAVGNAHAWKIEGKAVTRTIHGLRGPLAKRGLLGGKFVPREYLRGSIEQRLDFLRGLMDSGGSWNGKHSQAVFVNTSEGLARAVYELAVSLGMRASWWEGDANGSGKVVTQYRVSFTPTVNPFLSPLKADLVTPAGIRAGRRSIASVEPTLTVTTQCIEVDSPDHLYLTGEQMVPTHNTYNRPPWGLRFNQQVSAYCIHPDTPVLMADMTWKSMRDIQVGDELMATDEERVARPDGPSRRHWRRSTVEAKWSTKKAAYRLDLDDGTSLTVGAGHRILAQVNGSRWDWRTVEELMASLKSGKRRSPGVPVAKVIDGESAIQHDGDDYGLGYLAGATLGDGSIWNGRHRYASGKMRGADWQIVKGWRDQELMDRLSGLLVRHGIKAHPFRREPSGKGWQKEDVIGLRVRRRDEVSLIEGLIQTPDEPSDSWVAGWLAGLYDTDGCCSQAGKGAQVSFAQKDAAVLRLIHERLARLGFDSKVSARSVKLHGSRRKRARFFSVLRPALARKVERLDGEVLDVDADSERVMSITPLGEVWLMDMQTSTATYVSAGLVSHNCWASLQPQFWDAWPRDYLEPEMKRLAKRGMQLWPDKPGLEVIPRRGAILHHAPDGSFTKKDAGYRNERDYERFLIAAANYVRAMEGNFFPLSWKGETCQWCVHAHSGLCGGVPTGDLLDEGELLA